MPSPLFLYSTAKPLGGIIGFPGERSWGLPWKPTPQKSQPNGVVHLSRFFHPFFKFSLSSTVSSPQTGMHGRTLLKLLIGSLWCQGNFKVIVLRAWSYSRWEPGNEKLRKLYWKNYVWAVSQTVPLSMKKSVGFLLAPSEVAGLQWLAYNGWLTVD